MTWQRANMVADNNGATVAIVNTDVNATPTTDYQTADALARSIIPGARVDVTGYSVGYGRAMRIYRKPVS